MDFTYRFIILVMVICRPYLILIPIDEVACFSLSSAVAYYVRLSLLLYDFFLPFFLANLMDNTLDVFLSFNKRTSGVIHGFLGQFTWFLICNRIIASFLIFILLLVFHIAKGQRSGVAILEQINLYIFKFFNFYMGFWGFGVLG